ncbi:unnamed protein product [Rhodiola kirilowii]
MLRHIRRHVFTVSCKPGSNLSSYNLPEMRFAMIYQFCKKEAFFSGRFCSVANRIRLDVSFSRDYASAAGAADVVSSTDAEEEPEEVKELLVEMKKGGELSNQGSNYCDSGIPFGRYRVLKRRQVKIETEAWERAANEYRELWKDMCERKLAPNLPYMKSLFLGWFQPFRDAIVADQESQLFACNKSIASIAPYWNQLPADLMAVITMHKLMALLMTGTDGGRTRVVQAACTIGEAIEHEASIYKFLEKTKKRKNGKSGDAEPEVDLSLKLTPEQERLRKKVNDLLKKQKLSMVRHLVKCQDGSKSWGQDIRAKVGSRLIELLIQTAYIQSPINQLADTPPDVRPAFVHTTQHNTYEAGKFTRRYGMIECHPLVLKGLDRTARHMVIPYMPMLVPPINWSGYDKGAHFFLPSFVMRTHGSKHQRQAVRAVPREQINPVFEALNTLGQTRWRVNKRVLSVVNRLWALGGGLADLVECSDIPQPEEPDTEDEGEIKKWKWKVRDAQKENMERHSQRCDIELKLAVARKMKDEEGFYFPHNLDFRGRAYPLHPHLNHLGSDLCRGILEFGEGRPLGNSGLRWLKIHLANLFAGGVDKLSFEGRIAFTEGHIDDIFDSADRPLEGNRWWLKAEDPFQCLAVCINLAEAVRSSSPETYVSHIPVHQDGSCNGLQHYAALGRDKLGAAAVNLVAGEKPADVYSGIATRVLDIIKEDAKNDPDTFPNALYAKILVNEVNRKLVKQTVMTSVYGVTYVGARDQIKRRMKERGLLSDEAEIFRAACYAAKVTLTALGEMFESARIIMSWLGDCAKIIASDNHSVRWTTPLGLPVVQPYRILGKQHVKTSLQTLTLRMDTEKVMARRQRTAFPPNFVHSLDGSHMMMTAVACRKAGLNFAGVHDSFWTHACDVDEMNRILREKFVELYKAPILEQLLESFEQSFPTLSFPPLPERGDFDITEVLRSPYFFN